MYQMPMQAAYPQQAMPFRPIPMQYAQQQLPMVPYQMQGDAALNATFGTNYFAQGHGLFEFNAGGLKMSPAFSNSPLFEKPQGGVFGGAQGGGVQGGGMMGGGFGQSMMSPMYAGGGGQFGGADVFGQGMMPTFADLNGASQDPSQALFQNNPVSPFEQLPRGTAQSFNHYGFDHFGRLIGNFFDMASNGVDQLAYRNRVVGPVDPSTLTGSAFIANPIVMGQVFGVGPAGYAEVNANGAYAYGGAEAYSWNNRTQGQVLLDYDGPAIYGNSNPQLQGYGGR